MAAPKPDVDISQFVDEAGKETWARISTANCFNIFVYKKAFWLISSTYSDNYRYLFTWGLPVEVIQS
jgi:hypothetical protein